MATVIYMPSNAGLSVTEQKCYLEHAEDNKAIVACLDEYSRDCGTAALVVLVLFIIIVFFASR